MPESGWARHGLAIARQEFRRSLRSLRSDSTRLVFLGIGGLFISLFVVLGSWLVLRFASGMSPTPMTDSIRGSVGIQWFFAAFIFAQRAGSRYDRIDNESLMLMTVSVRAIVVGLLGAELCRTLVYIAFPVVAVGGAFVVATGSPLTAPFLVVAVVLLLLTAMVLGYAIGFSAKLLVARSRFVARYKSILTGVVVVAFIGAYVFVQNAAGGGFTAALGLLPMTWFVDLAVVGSPVVESQFRAAVAGVGGVVWLLGFGLVAERVATALWFGDTVENEVAQAKARVDTTDGSDPLAAAIRPLSLPAVRQPTLRVAQRAVLVTRRNPSRLSFVLLPVIFLGSGLVNVAQSGDLLSVLPPALALVVPWLAGAAFGLNPLGDEGPVLPATLTALASGRQYAAGLALPGLVLGLPLAFLGIVPAGVVGPYSLTEVGFLLSIALVFAVLAVTLAPAIGLLFPRFDPVRVGSEREVVPPNLSAVVVYSVLLLVPGALAVGSALAPAGTRNLLSLLVGGLLGFPFLLLDSEGVPFAGAIAETLRALGADIAGLPTAWVHWGGYGLPLLVAFVLCGWSVRAVGRRYRAYTIE